MHAKISIQWHIFLYTCLLQLNPQRPKSKTHSIVLSSLLISYNARIGNIVITRARRRWKMRGLGRKLFTLNTTLLRRLLMTKPEHAHTHKRQRRSHANWTSVDRNWATPQSADRITARRTKAAKKKYGYAERSTDDNIELRSTIVRNKS